MSINRTYEKLCVGPRLQAEIIAAGLPIDGTAGARFYGVLTNHSSEGDDTIVVLYDNITQNEITIVDNVVTAHVPTPWPVVEAPHDTEGKPFVRAESRPLNCTTYFTTAGDKLDTPQAIGDGMRLEWDAADEEYPWVEDTQAGVKRLTVDIQFLDSVWIKEGTVYWMDAAKDNYLDMYIVCPNGGYYMYLGEIRQNTTGNDLIVEHYVNKHPIQGDCPMGDEMNTETCSQEMPSYLKVRMIMTTPITDVTSHGYVELEMFRKRTVIL